MASQEKLQQILYSGLLKYKKDINSCSENQEQTANLNPDKKYDNVIFFNYKKDFNYEMALYIMLCRNSIDILRVDNDYPIDMQRFHPG